MTNRHVARRNGHTPCSVFQNAGTFYKHNA